MPPDDIAAFELGPGETDARDGYVVYRNRLLFRAGSYPDKQFEASPEEMLLSEGDDAIPNDLEHTETVLDSKLGFTTNRRVVCENGSHILRGDVYVPSWLAPVLPVGTQLSLAFDRATKEPRRNSYVVKARIPDAVLMAAFDASEGTWITLPGGRHIQIGTKEQGGGQGETPAAKPPAGAARAKETPEELKARTDRVMGKLPKVDEAIPGLRAKVESDLDKGDAHRDRVAAAVTRMMDQETIRVGSEKYADKEKSGLKGENSYGASSLRKHHAEVNGDTVTFRFPGKSKKRWNRSITDPKLAAAIAHLKSLPGERLMQYHEEGELKPFTETHAREYLDEHGITPKNLRTYHATRIATEHLQAAGAPADAQDAKRHIEAAVQAVSEHLGNTPKVARESYINPAVLEAYASGHMHGGAAQMSEGKKYRTPAEERFSQYLRELRNQVYSGLVIGVPDWDKEDPDHDDDEDGLDSDDARHSASPAPEVEWALFGRSPEGEWSQQ